VQIYARELILQKPGEKYPVVDVNPGDRNIPEELVMAAQGLPSGLAVEWYMGPNHGIIIRR